MRIHANNLTSADVYRAGVDIAPGVFVTVSQHGSRTHARAFEVSLEGNGMRGNSGSYGARDHSQPLAATWDEWGVFLGRLFLADPSVVCGGAKSPVYRDSEHYSWATGGRFNGGPDCAVRLPADTHKRHSWSWQGLSATGSYSVEECKKCSAIRRSVRFGHDWSEIEGN